METVFEDINTYTRLLKASRDDNVSMFLSGITTPHERKELANRFKIINLLKDGVSQHEISKQLQVGVATVSRGYQEEKQGKFDGVFAALPNELSRSFDFTGTTLPRLFKGNWQLSGGFGNISRPQAVADLIKYAKAGITVFDTGDIYGESESIIGDFLREYQRHCGDQAAKDIKVHTKFVPDLSALQDLTFEDVKKVIMRSKKRLGVDSIDLVQFHWWDFTKGNFVQAATWLNELRSQGHITNIGLTNFPCKELKILLDSGIPIVSNQIQFSLFDPRPLNGMLELAIRNNIAIFCYGTLSGGLLETTFNEQNRSHVKYNLIIEEAGKAYYRKCTSLLEDLAEKYRTTRSNIAIAFTLQTKGVSAVIVGPRNTNHLGEEKNIPNLSIDDYLLLRELLGSLQNLITDDIYSVERSVDGAHGRIMKYNQNQMRK